MMNEEKYIKEKMGTKNPFTVPEGYFEQLSDRIMSRLPGQDEHTVTDANTMLDAQQKPARTHRLRPWLAAASIAALVAVGATLFFGQKSASTITQENDEALFATNYYGDTYSDTYIEEEANYAMVDNQDIYAFLLADI